MVKISRYVYLVAAWLFLAAVVTQVFLAWMVVVARQISWNSHIELGHFAAAPLLLMLISMYLGRMPGSLKKLTWLLFVVYVLQADVIIFLRNDAPLVSAFHPVLALVDFALVHRLVRTAWPLARTTAVQPTPQAEQEPAGQV